MSSFIQKISQGVKYAPKFVCGYTIEELEKIERLYDIKITGDFRDYLLNMGRCDGGLVGDDPLILYSSMTVRGFVLFQSGVQEEIYDIGEYELSQCNPFVFSVESETQYFYLRTTSEYPERVYHYDENSGVVKDLGLSFVEYMREVVKTYGNQFDTICKGELLMI